MTSREPDGGRQARCAECYRALHVGCRNADVARLPADEQLWTLTDLVSDYAHSAREAHVRSGVVLANLHSALEPVARARLVPVELLIQRATADYYAPYRY